MTGLVVALLVCLGVGALWDRALFDVPGARLPERLGRGLMWGLGLVGACSMSLDAAGLPVTAGALGGMLAVLVVLLAWLARRRPEGGPAPPPPVEDLVRRPWARAAEAGLLAFASLSVGQAVFSGLVRPTFQFDSLTRWMFKAKVLFLEHSLRGPVSTSAEFAFTHQRYPPLVSHVANLPAMVNGAFDDRFAQAMFPWFAVALVLVLHGALARRVGRLKAALGAAWVGSLPLLSYLPFPPPGSGAASAMGDIPLSMFVTGAGLALIDALSGRRDRAHLEVAGLLAFAALTKNEGLPLLAGGAAAALLCAPRARVRRALGVALPGVVAYVLLWGRMSSAFPALDEDYAGQLGIATLLGGLDRLPLVIAGFFREVTHFRAWNLTWPLVLVLLLAGRPRRPLVGALVLVGVQLGAYTGAFLVTVWNSPGAETVGGHPVSYLMALTAGRLLMHVAPLAVATALMACPALLPAPRTAAPARS